MMESETARERRERHEKRSRSRLMRSSFFFAFPLVECAAEPIARHMCGDIFARRIASRPRDAGSLYAINQQWILVIVGMNSSRK